MKKVLATLVATAAMGYFGSASAATFTFENNGTGANSQTVDGITVTFSATIPGQSVAYYGGLIAAEKGIGIKSGGDSAALGQNQLLTVTFSQAVTIDSIRMGQWQDPDKVIFAASNGYTAVFDAETAFFSSYETFNTSAMGGITSFTLKGDSLGTQATLNRISGVTAAPIPEVPLPAAAWLFGSALVGLSVVKRRKT